MERRTQPAHEAALAQRRPLTDGEAVAPCATGDKPRPNPARARAHELREIGQLSARLRMQELPDIELSASDSMRVPLRAHTAGLVAVYFVPGEQDGVAWVDGHPTVDAAQHRGYVNREAAFAELKVRVFCVSAQPVEHLKRMKDELDAKHLMFSDPEMLMADALGLPALPDGVGNTCYRRLAVVADGGRIRGVFPVFQDCEAAASARQVLTWLTAKYGDIGDRGQAG